MLDQSLALAPSGSYIFISAKWEKEFDTDENFRQNIRELIKKSAKSQARVIFIGQIPTYEVSPNEARLRLEMISGKADLNLETDQMYRPVNTFLRQEIDTQNLQGNLVFIDPVSGLCHGAVCNTFSPNGVPYYIDQGHLTPAGAKAALVDLNELTRFWRATN